MYSVLSVRNLKGVLNKSSAKIALNFCSDELPGKLAYILPFLLSCERLAKKYSEVETSSHFFIEVLYGENS